MNDHEATSAREAFLAGFRAGAEKEYRLAVDAVQHAAREKGPVIGAAIMLALDAAEMTDLTKPGGKPLALALGDDDALQAWKAFRHGKRRTDL